MKKIGYITFFAFELFDIIHLGRKNGLI